MERNVRVIIELKEYSILKSMNDKLIEFNNAGEYEAFNALLESIIENYTPLRHIPNIYYLQ